jgi:hypothetical protein
MPNHPRPSSRNATGDTSDFERFTRFVRGIIQVPGSEVKQQIEAEKKARAIKRAKSSASRARADRES